MSQSVAKGRWLWVGLGRVELDPSNLIVSLQAQENALLVTDHLVIYEDDGKLIVYVHEDLVDGEPQRYVKP
jgi:hypothetical protein